MIAEEEKLSNERLALVMQHDKINRLQAFWNERHPDDEIEVGSMDLTSDEVRGLIAEYYSD